MSPRDRFRGCLLGLACGDAVGTTAEFCTRGSFPPVTDMVGGGVFGLKPGEWTDDTSMALCLAASLVETPGFDAADQMRRYCRWVHDGYIMRLAPVPMFFHPDREAVLARSAESSRLTHAAPECLDACRLFGVILNQALSGADKEAILFAHAADGLTTENVRAIARGDWRDKAVAEIKGSGYVVRSLEAALWCFWHTDRFEAAVLKATNLGDDADTTAAVVGQVAGAFYGEPGIPSRWLARVAMREEIGALALGLMHT